MSSNRVAVLLLVAGAHLAALYSLALHPPSRSVTRRAAESAPRSADATLQPNAVRTPPAASIDSAAAPDADARATASRSKRLAQIDRIRRRAYGDDIAALMRLPIESSWPRLERLALEGDVKATRALIDLSEECAGARDSDAARDGREHGLGPQSIALLQSAYRLENARLREFAASCRANEHGMSRLAGVLRQRGDDEPGDPVDEAIATAVARMRSGGASAKIDPSALIEAMADDPAAVDQVIGCLRLGSCAVAGIARDDATANDRAIERAARMGSQEAIAALVASAGARGDLLDAYAWARFGAWLAIEHCTMVPGVVAFLGRAGEMEALRRRLDAGQLAAAEQHGEDRIFKLGPAARAAQRCTE